jgi:putative hemolysin
MRTKTASILWFVAMLWLVGCTASPTPAQPTTEPGMPNPASVYCEERGGRLEVRTEDDGRQYGVCIFADDAATAISPTTLPLPTQTADQSPIDPLITSLTAAGATVVNNGRTEQGLFPVEGIGLWHLTVNDTNVNVYEFSDTATRETVSSNISPRGDEYTVTEGDTTVTATWDDEGLSRWWALDNLLVSYSGLDTAVISLLNSILGQPFADGSQPCRSEAGGGSIAGIDEYGVSFQYDPYLAAGIQPQIVDAFTEDNGMNYLLLPQHLSFTFLNSYADAEPLLQRQQLNLETMPQIVVYPATAYSAMHPLARTQIEQLQAMLAAQPSTPGGTMPYLPLHNAAQVFHSQLAYLAFTNGAGVRYVTAFSQDASPVTNQHLIYTFQGLTNDGQYYVAAFFPVKTAILPDTVQVDDWEAFSVSYSTYVAETKAALNDLTLLDFTRLDAVVASLRVEPDVELRGAETAVFPDERMLIAPIGVYQVYDSDDGLYRLYRVETDGRPQQVAAQRYNMLPAPDAAHAVYMDDDRRLWLVDLIDGSERQLAEGTHLSWLYLWGDAHTLLLGVFLSAAESEGLSTGHVATLDIDSGELHVIEEAYLSLGRPALAPDGQSIAYDVSAFSADVINSRIYHPDIGSQPLDPALFDGLEGERPCNLYNPAWSPDGRQLAWLCGTEAGSRLVVFDLVRRTAMTVFTWQPAQFGALPPSPVWSIDGKWLAIEIWANNEDESGLWVLPADGTMARLHVPTGREPIWLNPSQLFYADVDENMNGDIKLFDLDYGERGVLDLPARSTVLLTPPF